MSGLKTLLFWGLSFIAIAEIKASNSCPPQNPPEDILFPHETDCTKFYKCNWGVKVEQDCPEGLGFDFELYQCNWLENIECENGTGEGGAKDEDDSNSVEIENPETINEIDDQTCPPDNSGALLPHETDCSKFYSCANGKKYLMECPGGLHFNVLKGYCDWPENVDCQRNDVCPKDNFHIDVLLPHDTDCEKYYQCVHGEKMERDCPGGLHFNPSRDLCDWPQNVNCTTVGIPN